MKLLTLLLITALMYSAKATPEDYLIVFGGLAVSILILSLVPIKTRKPHHD